MEPKDWIGSVRDNIVSAGGGEADVELWLRCARWLENFCDATPGTTDDYTRDLVLCWAGWVLDGDETMSKRIYSAISGFNLHIRDDDDGQIGTRMLYEGIERHTSNPASVYRELAKDQIERSTATSASVASP